MLRPGGAFVFSSRHLATAPSAPWLWPTFVFDSNLYRLTRRNLSLLRDHLAGLCNSGRDRRHEIRSQAYAQCVDAGHQYLLLTCYVCPRWQIVQLEAEGFGNVHFFGKNGSLPEGRDDTVDPWVYYVAFKNATPTSSRYLASVTGSVS